MRAVLFSLSLFTLFVTESALADTVDLAALAGALRHESAEARAEAATKLSSLSRDDLPAIDARLTTLKRRVVDPEEGYQALRHFAHAVGSRRADDPVDIEPGVHERLKEARPTAVEAAIAEELLLLRSVEKMRSARAYRRAAQIFALHFDVFRWEARHSMARMGYLAMPAILDGISSGDAGLAAVARSAHAELGQPGPAAALRELEGEDRAELLLVYASRRVMDAMEPASVFLNDPDPVVRRAAIAAVKRYGRNAIWQIREAALLFLGEELDRSMGHEESLDYLLQRLDVQRAKPQLQLLQKSRQLLEEGELERARAAADRLWAERPELDEDGVASAIYEAIAERALEGGELEEAMSAFTQAALLARDEETRAKLEARAKELQRERLKQAGHFYFEKSAASADGRTEAGAQSGLEAGEEGDVEAEEESRLSRALFFGGLFLLIGSGRLLRGGRWVFGQAMRAGHALNRAKGPVVSQLSKAGGAAMRAARSVSEEAKAALRAQLEARSEAAAVRSQQEARSERAEGENVREDNSKASASIAPRHVPQNNAADSPTRTAPRAQLPIDLLKAPKAAIQEAPAAPPKNTRVRPERAEVAPALPPSLVFGAPKKTTTPDEERARDKRVG